MSFWVYLEKDGESVTVDRHAEGGTYAVGGISQAEINITYNYSSYFYLHLDGDRGLRWLDGKRGDETVERLEAAVETLGTNKDADYWASTSGNAGHALSILLAWAKQHPDAVWQVG